MGGAAASRLTAAGSGVAGTTLGAAGGAETHTLTIAQLAVHDHPLTGSVSNAGDMEYSRYTEGTARLIANGTGSVFTLIEPGSSSQVSVINDIHNHPDTFDVGNTGSGTAHNNVQPTIVFNKIIYAGV
jgi:microcystin-dependent protein